MALWCKNTNTIKFQLMKPDYLQETCHTVAEESPLFSAWSSGVKLYVANARSKVFPNIFFHAIRPGSPISTVQFVSIGNQSTILLAKHSSYSKSPMMTTSLSIAHPMRSAELVSKMTLFAAAFMLIASTATAHNHSNRYCIQVFQNTN